MTQIKKKIGRKKARLVRIRLIPHTVGERLSGRRMNENERITVPSQMMYFNLKTAAFKCNSVRFRMQLQIPLYVSLNCLQTLKKKKVLVATIASLDKLYRINCHSAHDNTQGVSQ